MDEYPWIYLVKVSFIARRTTVTFREVLVLVELAFSTSVFVIAGLAISFIIFIWRIIFR